MKAKRISNWFCLHVPAKLNLFLELIRRREDGFHELETLMVPIALYDTISVAAWEADEIRVDCEWVPGLAASAFPLHSQQSQSQPLDGAGAAKDSTVTDSNQKDHHAATNAASQTSERMGESLGTLPDVNGNIVTKAAFALRERIGSRLGIWIRIRKRIPAAAGLGGASADAAATLWAANKAWEGNCDYQQLKELAASIGSDVPFFLGSPSSRTTTTHTLANNPPTSGPSSTTGGSDTTAPACQPTRTNNSVLLQPAICRGRGELLEPLSCPLPRLHLVVVKPPIGLSTPKVFGNCQVPSDPVSVSSYTRALTKGNYHKLSSLMVNRLQPAAESLCEWIARLRHAFATMGCWCHQMTGSGSSYFGICRNERHAQSVANRLRSQRLGYVIQTTNVTTRWDD